MTEITAITVDPVERKIAVGKVPCDTFLIARRFASRPRVTVKFPNGDVLLAVPSETMVRGFTIGGSKPIAGSALVVGRRRAFGERAPARTSLQDIETMVRWISIER